MLLLEARMTTIVIIVLSLITARLVLVQFLPWCAYLVFCAWLVKRTDDPKALDHAASAAKAYPLRPLLWHRNDQPVESGLSQRTLGVLPRRWVDRSQPDVSDAIDPDDQAR
jgi:hypothetical protein